MRCGFSISVDDGAAVPTLPDLGCSTRTDRWFASVRVSSLSDHFVVIMRYFSLCSLLLLLATGTSAQVVQLTENPSISYLPEEIAIEASARSEGFPAVVAWGSTAVKEGNAYRHVLYAQGVRESGPIGEPSIITDEEAHPTDLVRVIPFYNMYLVLWNDERSDEPGLYGQYVDVGGLPIAETSERFGQGGVSRLTTVPNNDGTRLILWNEGDRGEGRLLRLDRNGNRIGLVQGIGAGVDRVIDFSYDIYDRFIVQVDGSAIPLEADGTFDYSSRLSADRLNQIALIGADGDVWTSFGKKYYHFPGLWSTLPDDSLSLPDPERPETVMLSHINGETYLAHQARIEYAGYRESQYPTMRDSTWQLRLYTTAYNRRSGVILDRDSTVLYSFGTSLTLSGSSSQSRTTKLIRSAVSSSGCPGQTRASYTFHSVYTASNQLREHDTIVKLWGIDPWSGALVLDQPPPCTVHADSDPVVRGVDSGFSVVHYRGFTEAYALNSPAANVESYQSTWYLGLHRDGDDLYLLHNALPAEESSVDVVFGRNVDLSRIDLSVAHPLVESHRHYPLWLRSHTRRFPVSPLITSREWDKIEHFRTGPVSLIWRSSYRYDLFEATSSNDYPSYQAHMHDLSTVTGTMLNDVGGLFRDSASYQWNEPDFPELTHVAWNPEREEALVSTSSRDAGYIVAVDRSGSIEWSFRKPGRIAPESRIIGANVDEVLVVQKEELLRMDARGTEVIGVFPTVLEDVEVVQLYHNRFLRYGFNPLGDLVLETYSRELAQLQTLGLADSEFGNLRILLADDHGDSALVLLSTEGSQIVVQTMNQSLEGLVTERFDALPDHSWMITDLYGAFLNDTLVVAFVGRDPRSGDNEVYAHGLPVPDVPEEEVISGVREGIAVRNNHSIPTTTAVPLRVSPNPVSGQLGVTYSDLHGEKGRLRVVDLLGRTIVEQPLGRTAGEESITVDLSSLLPGAYLVEIRDGERRGIEMIVVR